MRYFLLIIFCSVSISASAQWYKNPIEAVKYAFKKHTRYPMIANVQDNSVRRMALVKLPNDKITKAVIDFNPYALFLMEASVMRTAQHNMRFRIYNAASYNFSDLAQMYLKQNRLSEAKWYLLQSLQISRQQNDDRHTITNLMGLATVKAGYGDYVQANQDLAEARTLAASRGLNSDVTAIEKQMRFLQDNKLNPRAEIRYAEIADAGPKPANK